MEATLGFQTKRELILRMAPHYRSAPISQKGALLDEIAATTGYARRYTMWLLNHPEGMQPIPCRQRQRTFGPDIQRALFFVWQHANQICTKRLMPYLATHLEALEWHGHLHLTDSCRNKLLSMSAATADHLLHGPRMHGAWFCHDTCRNLAQTADLHSHRCMSGIGMYRGHRVIKMCYNNDKLYKQFRCKTGNGRCNLLAGWQLRVAFPRLFDCSIFHMVLNDA